MTPLNSALESFALALPKAELHLHFEGSVPADLALALAKRYGITLPAHIAPPSPENPAPRFVFADFHEFVTTYLAISSCLTQVEDIRAAADAIAATLSRSNVRYAEITFTPLTHIARGVPPDTLLNGLLEGREVAFQKHGVLLRYVFDIVRNFHDQARPTLDFALEVQKRDQEAIVGLGLAGPESDEWPVEPFTQVFARAKSAGLRSLPHAGELGGPASLWRTVNNLQPDRIGHGIRCLEDPRLVEHLREHAITLEVCPTSNVCLQIAKTLAEHPLPALMATGIPVVLSSDDPALFATDLAHEYALCAHTFGWSSTTLSAFAREGFIRSFMPEPLRAKCLQEIRGVEQDYLAAAASPS